MPGKPKKRSDEAKVPVTFDLVREIARGLPEAEEGTSYGTPAFRVRKTLFVRQHQDGESLVIKVEPDHRAFRMKVDPETFFITDHYRDTPWMLVRLSTVAPDDLRDLLEEAWKLSAPKPRRSTRNDGEVGKNRGRIRKPRRQ